MKPWLYARRWPFVFTAGILVGLLLYYAGMQVWRIWHPPAKQALVENRGLGTRQILPWPTPFQRQLNAANSQCMQGADDPENERWLDCAGNVYSSDFIRNFSYTGSRPIKPVVRVRYDRQGPTFRGRIEAERLKPNFAYQLKLLGDYQSDQRAFEIIGYAGRWRLPGRPTNYSDWDYQTCSAKSDVEAYLLFDFFVTDKNGRAVKDFELNSTLHVLFNAIHQGLGSFLDTGFTRVIVEANDPRMYALPKSMARVQFIWAESEKMPGRADLGNVRLPDGSYQARLILTEESFHSFGDGGFWATVMKLPVSFVISNSTPARAGAVGPGS